MDSETGSTRRSTALIVLVIAAVVAAGAFLWLRSSRSRGSGQRPRVQAGTLTEGPASPLLVPPTSKELPETVQPPPAQFSPPSAAPTAANKPAVAPPSATRTLPRDPTATRPPASLAAGLEVTTTTRPELSLESLPTVTSPQKGSGAPEAVPSRASPKNFPAPAQTATKPLYNGPQSGTIHWLGVAEKDGIITIDGDSASSGSVTGGLPGVPVQIELSSKDVAVAEAPGPSNGWKKIAIRSRRKQTDIAVRWAVLP